MAEVEAARSAPAGHPNVFGVFVWRADGVYRKADAVRVFKRRAAAERVVDAAFAEDCNTPLVVREVSG
jgi:hypothetical protein